MSRASDRARALLGAATQGKWLVGYASRSIMAWTSKGPTTGLQHEVAHLAPITSGPDWRYHEADCRLIAEACSPEDGLLDALAGEVERLEAAAVAQKATTCCAGHAPDCPFVAALLGDP